MAAQKNVVYPWTILIGEFTTYWVSVPILFTISHWMPLPKPPGE